MIGIKGLNGKIATASDYSVQQSMTTLGVISGWRIVQILWTIRPGAQPTGSIGIDEPPMQWKSLVVGRSEAGDFLEIYHLQGFYGTLMPLKSAAIYAAQGGTGSSTILGTFDPDSGNGGGCTEGYWWFDREGPHAVDFSPLERAVGKAIPPGSTFYPNCWSLHPDQTLLRSGVQQSHASCHACGWNGTVEAHYRIEGGSALPVSVEYKPAQP